MDAFFVGVELLERPELRGKPVFVGHRAGRSVVTSASYEARRFGVRSAMPVAQALRLCPQAHVLEPHMEKYRTASRRVMALFAEVTPLVEPLSIDEAFLDVAGARRLLGEPAEIAAELRGRMVRETGLTCSIGAAATKFVAKLASTRAKPDGLLVVPTEAMLAFLHPLPVGALWGVGRATADVLSRRALRTVADIAHTPKPALQKLLGEAAGARLHDLSWGRDPRRVSPVAVEKSIGQENTFRSDVTDEVQLHRELLRQAEQVGTRLRRAGLLARTVSIKLRFADFSTVSRTRTLTEATDLARRIYSVALALLAEQHLRGRPVRLIGIRAEELTDDRTTSLWSEDDDWQQAEAAVDAASAKFGRGAVRPAALFPAPGSNSVPEAPSRPASG